MSEPQYQITYERKRTNHILHLLLTLVTFGLWIPVWILVAMGNANQDYREAGYVVTGTGVPTTAPPRPPRQVGPASAPDTNFWLAIALLFAMGVALLFSAGGKVLGGILVLSCVATVAWKYRKSINVR